MLYTIESVQGIYDTIIVNYLSKTLFTVTLRKVLNLSKKVVLILNRFEHKIAKPPIFEVLPVLLKLNIIGGNAII